MMPLVVACGLPSPPVPEEHIALEQVILTAGQMSMHLASATIGADGQGHGTAVQATQQTAPPLTIDAPTVRWDLKRRVAVFEGGAVVKRHDITLTARSITVAFGEGETVDRAQADGDVVLLRGERTATAQQAILHGESGLLELLGEPELVEGQHRMRGQRILLWLDDEKVECQGCRLVIDGDSIGADRAR